MWKKASSHWSYHDYHLLEVQQAGCIPSLRRLWFGCCSWKLCTRASPDRALCTLVDFPYFEKYPYLGIHCQRSHSRMYPTQPLLFKYDNTIIHCFLAPQSGALTISAYRDFHPILSHPKYSFWAFKIDDCLFVPDDPDGSKSKERKDAQLLWNQTRIKRGKRGKTLLWWVESISVFLMHLRWFSFM